MSVEDRVWDLRGRFCVEAVVQDPFVIVRLSVQGVYKNLRRNSLQEILK